MKDIIVRNGFDNVSLSGRIFTPKINIAFTGDNSDRLGKFFEDENGKMSFEGDVNESAKIFIEHSLKSFNERIEQIKRESQPKDLWAECVAMADKKEHKIEYSEGVYKLKYLVERRGSNSIREYYFENSNVNMKSNSLKKIQFTLPELHAKLTELTKC